MKKTETRIMLEICQEGVQDSNVTDAYIEEMKELTLKDPIEFQDLINIFNEEKKDETFILCFIAEVLVFLKWKPTIKYLYDIIEKSKSLSHKIMAAEYLVDMNDKKVWEYLIKLTKEAQQINNPNRLGAIGLIFAKANTPASAKLFMVLEKQYPDLNYNLSKEDQKRIHELAKK